MRTALALLLAAASPLAATAAAPPSPPPASLAAAAASPAPSPTPAAEAPRPLRPDDVWEMKRVSDPRLSPDGKWVAYVVAAADRKRDDYESDLWMAPLDGGAPVRLTSSEKNESHPRFSPDGKWLAFLSNRDGKTTDVYLLDRRGGEAQRLTELKANVSDLAWSPDSQRLALVVHDRDPDEPAAAKEGEKKTAKPIVIRRLWFKEDEEGYLDERRDHLWLFDLGSRKAEQITQGPYDDREPAFSPDGRTIAFVSNRTPEPDANENTDIFLVEARPGAEPRRLTASDRTDSAPAWSPDGKSLFYLEGGDPDDFWYGTDRLASVEIEDGHADLLTPAIDRNLFSPRASADGKWVYVLLEDDGSQSLVRVAAHGGTVETVLGGERNVAAYDLGAKGEVAVLESQWDHPDEVSALDAGKLRPLSRANAAFLAGIELGRVSRFTAQAPGGPEIHAFLTLPPGVAEGKKLPTLLRLHGGPVDQFSWGFQLDWQMLAAQGYAVVGPNPRGSSGRGLAFARAIWADWGNKDFQDVMAATDQAIALGVADPERLGVFGWSYGGILTDYVITQTTRFKGAASGASEVMMTSDYGVDQYQYAWEKELGLPWRNIDLWLRLSPFMRVDKVTTPTLILCGTDDWNVPASNSEQLYQALRRLGKPTELVLYPGQSHGFSTPSYIVDRYQRYVGWFDRWVKGTTTTAAAAAP